MKKKAFWKTFLVFLIAGMTGVVLLIPMIMQVLEEQLQSVPNPPDLPFFLLVLLSLINPMILLVIAILAGQLTAPKVNLVSYLYLWVNGLLDRQNKENFKASLPLGFLSGAAVAVFFFVSDLLFKPYLPEGLQAHAGSRDGWTTVLGIFYGGITEEILLRWGLMSLLVIVLWKVFQRRKEQPTASVFWVSILISSLLFAIGHIGATAMAAPLTAVVLTRMMLLNGIGGIVFGWLYWKKGLEIAMVSHASTHIVMTIINFFWFL